MEDMQASETHHTVVSQSNVFPITHQSHITDASDVMKRRSSNRSIKRKKFDDELVEYSLGLPNVNTVKSSHRARTQSHSELPSTSSPAPPPTAVVIPAPGPTPLTPSTPSTSTSVTHQTPLVPIDLKRKPSIAKTITPSSSSASSKRSKKGRQQNQITTKDLGRWKPTDDLALIIGVQQTNDLRTVHLGTKFSCKFTVQELQQRWYALLYDQSVSRVAVSAMRNLHPDMIASVHDKALWSQSEENILSTIKSSMTPTLETFAELLAANPDMFYSGRTPNALHRHWQTMKMYQLLPDQVPPPISGSPIRSFNDAEETVQDAELSEPADETLDREMKLQQRKNIKQIRQLENEVGRLNVLVDSVTRISTGELDGQTLAVLRGRLVRYLMRSKEITIGRSSKGFNVDIDLTLEGPAHKVSRKQGTLRLRNTGEFYLSSEGKRPIFVDGRPITTGNKIRLYDNSVVEISCLRFIFSVNHTLIRSIHDSLRFNSSS